MAKGFDIDKDFLILFAQFFLVVSFILNCF